jgi:hypothetical protein
MRLIQIKSEKDVEKVKVGSLLFIEFSENNKRLGWNSRFVVVTGKDRSNIEIKNNTIWNRLFQIGFTTTLNFRGKRAWNSELTKYFLVDLKEDISS